VKLPTFQTFVCPTCGQERSGVRRRCYSCTGFKAHTPETRERIRQTLTGVKHPPERVQANSLGHKGKRYGEAWAAARRGHPAPNHVPVGHRRKVKGAYWQIKCPDGRFRYEHRVVWEAAHGPLPRGLAVHHINHDGFDNRLENLVAITPSEHSKHHASADRMREAQKLGVAARLRNREARGGRY